MVDVGAIVDRKGILKKLVRESDASAGTVRWVKRPRATTQSSLDFVDLPGGSLARGAEEINECSLHPYYFGADIFWFKLETMTQYASHGRVSEQVSFST